MGGGALPQLEDEDVDEEGFEGDATGADPPSAADDMSKRIWLTVRDDSTLLRATVDR